MAQENLAISVNNVTKEFKLPHQGATSVKSLLTGFYRREDSSVQKSQELQLALDGVGFKVEKGEFFGIVGRNGSGKSTLLKILAGIYQPTSGDVSVYGKLVPFIELGVGFNPELTGRENVYLNGAMLGLSTKEIDALYDDIVGFAELERFMDQKLKNYSSGMQVRLAFSMATRSEADVLLVDEVLAVGDADFQRKCFDYFKQLKRNKKTVIFVTHDMSAIREYCDRAIMIENSRVVEIGSPEDIAQAYSKLFAKEEENLKQKEASRLRRWGKGEISYETIKVTPGTIRPGVTVKIDAYAKATKKIHQPIYGFSIKDSSGKYILGTNTRIKKLKTNDIEAGTSVHVAWEVPNIFGEGTYYVNVAIGKNDGVTNHDWWEEATSFNAYRDEKTPYIVTPDISVNVTKDD